MRTNIWVNGLLLVAFILTMMSGFGGRDGRLGSVAGVDPAHLTSGLVMIAVILVHLALHWRWIVSCSCRYLGLDVGDMPSDCQR